MFCRTNQRFVIFSFSFSSQIKFVCAERSTWNMLFFCSLTLLSMVWTSLKIRSLLVCFKLASVLSVFKRILSTIPFISATEISVVYDPSKYLVSYQLLRNLANTASKERIVVELGCQPCEWGTRMVLPPSSPYLKRKHVCLSVLLHVTLVLVPAKNVLRPTSCLTVTSTSADVNVILHFTVVKPKTFLQWYKLWMAQDNLPQPQWNAQVRKLHEIVWCKSCSVP